MNENYKEQLSRHVEQIFKRFISQGLHICDLATGGGKSYTIGKLACEYYPRYFNRIVILCVQTKLVANMNKDIERFINSPYSKIKPEEKLVVEKNVEVIKKAIKDKKLDRLIDEMEMEIGEQRRRGYNVGQLQETITNIKRNCQTLSLLIRANESNEADSFQAQIDQAEIKIRNDTRKFFEVYKNHLLVTKQKEKVSYEYVFKKFKYLTETFPQADLRNKRLLIMTVHKAMYGVDPIISDKIDIINLAEKDKTLIFYDESDQAAIAMRDCIINKSIENNSKLNGYEGYLEYKSLVDKHVHITNEYYGEYLKTNLSNAQTKIEKRWQHIMGDVEPYLDILLEDPYDVESYRRGVFFSGPMFKLNIGKQGDKNNIYICYKEGASQLSLAHSEKKETLEKEYKCVVPLLEFLNLIVGNTTIVKSHLRDVIHWAYTKSIEKANNYDRTQLVSSEKNTYMGYPTIEREIHTLVSRFKTSSPNLFEFQLKDFYTNRKNRTFRVQGKDIKLTDFSVYSQGVQLYQEEIDRKDNLHGLALKCREITTTPEKIIYEQVCAASTSIVLCSATASCSSVVSNFDIKYLRTILGEKFHTLSDEDINRFDELVALTYPQEHKVEIVPIERYKYTDNRLNHIFLPSMYKDMFCQEAIEEGYVDAWFMCTIRELESIYGDANDIVYHLCRLYQFVRVYKFFITHKGIHSMIFFQNRTGDKDQRQYHIISCLIDGTYKKQDSVVNGERPEDWANLPTDWINENLFITKDLNDIENNALKKLREKEDAKLMLISAYNSLKAGTNLQYVAHPNCRYLKGDNWESDENMKKDWDAIYLQCPTNYLRMTDDENSPEREKELYNAMLNLMMLHEEGYLSKAEVAQWMYKALTNKFWFGDKNNSGVFVDKAAWVQYYIEQAIGRLCRTKNKPYCTYILFDEAISPYLVPKNMKKSLTKEFKALASYILEHQNDVDTKVSDSLESIRCNKANTAEYLLDNRRKLAYINLPHPHFEYYEDADSIKENLADEGIPHNVQVAQTMIKSYKQTIIRKPVISGLEELTEEDRQLTFIDKCYGNWQQDSGGGYVYYKDEYKHICPFNNTHHTQHLISPSIVRLDILMKNEVVRKHFEVNGYATDWKQGELILHPNILAYDYAGEIGEEAFKAIVLEHTDCTEEDLVHLKGKDYELADFVVLNPDGSYKVAFDVKNMNPHCIIEDAPCDLPTNKKRKEKEKRLGCKLYTINIIEMDEMSIDPNEICGIIDNEGEIIINAIKRLKLIINN